MPPYYDFPAPEVDAWIPFQLDPASDNFGAHFIGAIARLKPGVTIEAATDDARSLIGRFNELGYAPSWFKDVFDGGAIVRPLREEITGDARESLLIVFGTSDSCYSLHAATSPTCCSFELKAAARRTRFAWRLGPAVPGSSG